MRWKFWERTPEPKAATQTAVDRYRNGVRARARTTAPDDPHFFRGTGIKFIPRRAYHALDIDQFDATQYSAPQILDILADISPEVSLALWNVLRLGAVNYQFRVLNLNGKTPQVRLQKRLNDWLFETVNKKHGGFQIIMNQAFMTSFLQGAHCLELEVEPGLTNVVDIHSVQPWTIKFDRDPNTKDLIMYQDLKNSREPKRLNDELVWYVGIDASVDDPYGRAPAAAVIWPLTFDLQFVRDLKQAIHVTGWGRIDVKVIQEIAVKNAPPDVRGDSVKLRDYMNGVVDDVTQAFETLRSDDTFVHTDSIEISDVDPSGKMSSGVTPLSRLLEARLTRGLKQLPILMGGSEGRTETQGTVQYEIYTNGMQALRDVVGRTFSQIGQRVLEIWGAQGRVEVHWESIRSKDRLREAQAEQLEIINAAWKRDQGWIDNDMAAMEITGNAKAVAEPTVVARPADVPRMPGSTPAHEAAPDPSPTEGEPGRPVDANSHLRYLQDLFHLNGNGHVQEYKPRKRVRKEVIYDDNDKVVGTYEEEL